MRRRLLQMGLVGVVCLAACGCDFLRARGRDLKQSFKFDVGVGLPFYMRMKCTDWFVLGGGYAMQYYYHPRDLLRAKPDLRSGKLESAFGVPLAYNVEETDFYKLETAETRVVTRWPFFTTRTYAPDTAPPPLKQWANRYWIGMAGTLLASARLGFNPIEFADFVSGWFGDDLLADDAPPPAEPTPKEGEK